MKVYNANQGLTAHGANPIGRKNNKQISGAERRLSFFSSLLAKGSVALRRDMLHFPELPRAKVALRLEHLICIFIVFLGVFILSSCIGDDIVFDEVEESVRILNPVESIGVNETYQFTAIFTNNVGMEEPRTILWSSSDPSIVEIDATGFASAKEKGITEISASVEMENNEIVADVISVMVNDTTVISNQVRTGELSTTSSYTLEGAFTITENDDNSLTISLSDDYKASESLPGLYIYLGNNPSTISSALEIGAVNVYNGSHSYTVENVGINDYTHLLYWCKPFNVKVGEGVIN